MLDEIKKYFDSTPEGFASVKILWDKKGSISDLEIIYLNQKLIELFAENNITDKFRYMSEMHNAFGQDVFAWIKEAINEVLSKKSVEKEFYFPITNAWYKIRFICYDNDIVNAWVNDITSEKLVVDASQAIIKSKRMTLGELAEKVRIIAGAKYCLMNLFSEDGSSFTTVEIAGNKEHIPIMEKTLGFNPENKTWQTHPEFTNAFKQMDIFHIPQFDSFMGVRIPPEKLKLFKEQLNIGSISLCKIESNETLLGVMTLIFEKKCRLKNEYNLINYAQIIGLYLIRKKLEEENQQKEVEIKRSRERIVHEKERLEYVLKGINAGTWEWNIQSGETKFNERWAGMLGYTLAELEPTSFKTWHDLIVQEDMPIAEKALQDHFNKKTEFYDTEFRMKHKEGHFIWVQDKGRVEKWTESGEPLLMYGTHQDITSRKLNEIALQNAKKEKEEFFASISHDLKNPMNGIIGFANLLKDSLTNPEDIDCIDSILESSDTMMKLISNILDFSKAEAGKLSINEETTDLRKLLHNVCKTIKQSIGSKPIFFDCNIDQNIPKYIITDPLRLNQIIVNLLSNAVKFTAEGSILFTLNCEAEDAGESSIRFTVKDTGIGMSKSETERIMNYFTQGNTAIESRYGGSGLGLFIASKILEKMGSQLDISSSKGKGSEFSFILTLKNQIIFPRR